MAYKEHLLLQHPHPVVLCPELQLFIYRMTSLVTLLWISTSTSFPLVSSLDLTNASVLFSSGFVTPADLW